MARPDDKKKKEPNPALEEVFFALRKVINDNTPATAALAISTAFEAACKGELTNEHPRTDSVLRPLIKMMRGKGMLPNLEVPEPTAENAEALFNTQPEVRRKVVDAIERTTKHRDDPRHTFKG
jgi:hypothetical protein